MQPLPVIPPPPRRRLSRRTRALVLALVLLVGGVALGGGFLVVKAGADLVRTGGHPEMAELLAATGLAEEFDGTGQQRSGERLGLGAPATVYERYRPAGSAAIPYDRVRRLVEPRGWAPRTCSFTGEPGARCWARPSPERDGVTYELRLSPGPPPATFTAEVSELPVP